MQEFDWQPINPASIPQCRGIYGIVSEPEGEWFYIGKAENIAKRFQHPSHPFKISSSLNRAYSYWFIPSEGNISRLERAAIREMQPIGNGGTSFDGYGTTLQCVLAQPSGVTRSQVKAAIASLNFSI